MSPRAQQLALGLCWWAILVACCWLYWSGLHGSFVFDDGVNLRHLEALDTGADFINDVLSGNISGPLGRPLSMLSFAATYLAYGSDPWWFKLHNLALHLVNGCLLYWFAWLLAARQRMPNPAAYGFWVAAIWIVSPLFVSTVLYAVQRMTQLSTLFVLAGMITYCKGRQPWSRHPYLNLAVLLAVPLFLVAAVLSKENALVALPLLLLTEFAFFRPAEPSPRYLRGQRLVVVALLLCALIIIAALVLTPYGAALLNYGRRSYSLLERVLTEARVLFEYAGKFLLLLHRGEGLYHDDFRISSSLFAPLSTLFSVIGLLVAASWSLWALVARRQVLIGYGILFFLAGHALESSIFPLEIYFEHRNYLPAVGLALALVSGLMQLERTMLQTPARLLLVGLVVIAALDLGVMATWWSNKYLFAIRNIEEHPLSVRANMDMAVHLAESGHVDAALAYSGKAADIGGANEVVRELRNLGLYCMARQAVPDAAFVGLELHVEDLNREESNEALQIVSELVVSGHCDTGAATRLADIVYVHLSAGAYFTAKAVASMAKIENALHRYDRALDYAGNLRDRNPSDPMANLMVLYFSWILGDSQGIDESLRELERLDCEGSLRLEDVAVYREFVRALEHGHPQAGAPRACPPQKQRDHDE